MTEEISQTNESNVRFTEREALFYHNTIRPGKIEIIASKPMAASFPAIGGGTWTGVAFVWAILAVSLLPFFALREIAALLGEGRLWALMFYRDARAEITMTYATDRRH